MAGLCDTLPGMPACSSRPLAMPCFLRVRRLNLTIEGHLLTVLQRGYPAVAAALAAAGLLVRRAWDCLAVRALREMQGLMMRMHADNHEPLPPVTVLCSLINFSPGSPSPHRSPRPR